MGAARAPMVLQ